MKLKVVILLAIFALLPIFPVFADEQVIVQDQQGQVKVVVFRLNDKNYYVQDAAGNVKTTQMDVIPYMDTESGRTFVPVRFLGNALGLSDDKIKWDDKTRITTLTGPKILILTLGSKIMKSDGDNITMDVSPGVKPPGRTMLPARWVAQGLGFTVEWDQQKQIVICYPSSEQQRPDLTKIFEEIQKQNQQNQQIPAGVPEEGTFKNMVVKGTKLDDLGLNPNGWGEIFQYCPNTQIYTATVSVNELNTGKYVLDGIRISNFKIIEKGTLEDFPNSEEINFDAVALWEPGWLEILYVDKNNTIFDERQCDIAESIGQNTWRLRYPFQHTKNDFRINLKDVKYFLIDGSGDIRDGSVGMLLVKNPYFKG